MLLWSHLGPGSQLSSADGLGSSELGTGTVHTNTRGRGYQVTGVSWAKAGTLTGSSDADQDIWHV
jgi:hypothetical protein